jgi:hypothetical protein
MNDEILNKLHKIAMAFEDNGNEELANELHDVFLKLSAKKKKKNLLETLQPQTLDKVEI